MCQHVTSRHVSSSGWRNPNGAGSIRVEEPASGTDHHLARGKGPSLSHVVIALLGRKLLCKWRASHWGREGTPSRESQADNCRRREEWGSMDQNPRQSWSEPYQDPLSNGRPPRGGQKWARQCSRTCRDSPSWTVPAEGAGDQSGEVKVLYA